jgi:hypothetical protein
VKSSAFSGRLPSTGVARFDRLMVGTEQYLRWVARLNNRGFYLIEQSLMEGTAAQIEDWIIIVDPAQFRYIDLLHESRHLRQLERALLQGFDAFAVGKSAKMMRAWFELGAYEYEQRVGLRFQFSDEYMAFLERQINHYWKRTYRQEIRFSSTAQRQFNRIWR